MNSPASEDSGTGTVRADVHLPYFRKFLFIGLGCAAYGLWCVYDLYVTYPAKLAVAEAYEGLADHPDRDQEWIRVAEQNGWSAGRPRKSAAEVRGLMATQKLMIVGCVVVGTWLLVKYMRARGTWIEGDEHKIVSSWGKEIVLDDIVSIDKRRWESKGIAVLQSDNGQDRRKFVLDDFKYDQDAVGKLLTRAEASLEANSPLAHDQHNGE